MSKTEYFGIREICRETILGFQFWSLFGFFAPMIWFFPLNAMEVSGYEVFLLVLFSPVLIGPAWARKLVQTRTGHGVIRLLSVASLASFQAPTTIARLSILAAGNFFVMLSLTASLWSPSLHQRFLTLWGLLLGLVALLVSRIWYTTYVPTWTDVTSNNIVIAIVTIATGDKIIAGDDNSASEENASAPKAKGTSSSGPWIRAGLGFGGLLNITLWLFTDVSVILRWGFKSLPDSGPHPYPWGLLVLCAVLAGVCFSAHVHKYNRFGWLVVGVAGFLCLNYLDRWFALAGGLALAVFILSLWPTMVELMTSCPPGRTMALAMFTWIYVILHEIWTVAYNFVPGGMYAREHTDHVIAVVMITVGLGYLAGKSSHKLTENKTHNGKIIKVLILMFMIGAAGYINRLPKQKISHPPKIYPKDDFTAGVWAFHFGYDNKGWPSMVPSSQFIQNSEVDFLGLLETDASKPFLGNHDLLMWLSERLGMYADFGPSTRDHCWGVAFLSKYPIVKTTHHLLPSPYGELAPAIHATVNMTDKLIDIIVTHMGNEWDSIDRELQAEALAALMRNAENPVIFLGYVTSKPDSRDYKTLTEKGNVKDIDHTDMKRFCEYIFYRGLIRRGYARISHGGLSDTEMQLGRFRVPRNPQNYRDNSQVTTSTKKVDKHIRFNPLFGQYSSRHNWKGGHKFHMDTPKYFLS